MSAEAAAAAEAKPGEEPNSGDKRKREDEPEVNAAAVLKQLTFYFSDSNLPKDKFLRELTAKGDEGWVDFATIAKFKRMVDLCPTQDLTVLGGIVREGDSDLLEVSEDNKKIRRSPKHALPAESKTDKQSIYVKGWDLKGTTIDSVEKYFTDKGYKVLATRLRRAPATREFKGSTFVELSSVEEAQKCVAEKHMVADRVLLVEMKEAYHERKSAERKERLKKRKLESGDGQGLQAGAAAAEPAEFVPGCVLKFEGLTDETRREDIKEVFEKLAEVSWVDFQQGDTSGELRFAAGTAQAAKDGYEKAPTEINGKIPTLTVLVGEEEKAFWVKVAESKKQKYDRSRRNKGGGRGWGNRRSGGGGRGKRKSGDGENSASKKAKAE